MIETKNETPIVSSEDGCWEQIVSTSNNRYYYHNTIIIHMYLVHSTSKRALITVLISEIKEKTIRG